MKIAAGTDFGGGSLRANQLAWEVEEMVEAGLQPWQALAAATWRGGELLGEPDAGVIREGGPADFFLVHGDPLSDPSALWRVWRVAWADCRPGADSARELPLPRDEVEPWPLGTDRRRRPVARQDRDEVVEGAQSVERRHHRIRRRRPAGPPARTSP